MLKRWYYLGEGSQIEGPVEFWHLADLLPSLPAGLNTLVWTEGMSGWERAASNIEILRELNVPLPPPARLTTSNERSDPTHGSNRRLLSSVERAASGTAPPLSAGSTSDENKDEHASGRLRTLHPWRRFFARQIDLFFVMLALSTTLNLILAESASGVNKAFENNAIVSVISVLVLIPFEAFLLGMFGGTLGKALYGITVHQSSGEPLGLGQAWWRSWAVAFRGLAMGMPFFSLFTMGSAYLSLTKVGAATWDRDGGFTVEHGRLGFFRIALLVVVWCGIAALFFAAA